MKRKSRVFVEVIPISVDGRMSLAGEVLRSDGWILEDDRLIYQIPKDVLTAGTEEMTKALHQAITKMQYLLDVAQVEYDMRIVSESIPKDVERVKIKICLVGDEKVGKTSLIRKYVLDQFDDKYIRTIGAKVCKKEVTIPISRSKEARVDMTIWDIMGKKSIADLYKDAYFTGAQGILAVCDVTRRNTLTGLEGWISGAMHIAGNVPVHILVNKIDLEDEVEIDKRDIAASERKLSSPHLLTSAKNGENVEKAFHDLALRILEQSKSLKMQATSGS